MSVYGTAPAIQTEQPDRIRIVEKAELDDPLYTCCSCCINVQRDYFHVLEHAYIRNHPKGCLFFRPSCLCRGIDNIHMTYYDRGVFDQQSCLWKIGYYGGDPVIVANDVKYVCFCQECTWCSWNGWGALGICFWMCGREIPDRIRVLKSEYWCWCCPNRASWCHNWCGLCGIKSGEPLFYPHASFLQDGELVNFDANTVARCLKRGTGESLALSMNNARAEWKRRTRL